jgi:hypothetical protein
MLRCEEKKSNKGRTEQFLFFSHCCCHCSASGRIGFSDGPDHRIRFIQNANSSSWVAGSFTLQCRAKGFLLQRAPSDSVTAARTAGGRRQSVVGLPPEPGTQRPRAWRNEPHVSKNWVGRGNTASLLPWCSILLSS